MCVSWWWLREAGVSACTTPPLTVPYSLWIVLGNHCSMSTGHLATACCLGVWQMEAGLFGTCHTQGKQAVGVVIGCGYDR